MIAVRAIGQSRRGGDPGRRLGGQRGGRAGAGERVAHVLAGAVRPAQPEAEDERDQPPGDGDEITVVSLSRFAADRIALIAPSTVASAPVMKTVARSRSV